MKKKLISILLAVMTISASVPAFAAPSISQIIPEAPKVVEGNLKAGEELVVQDVKTEEYKDKKVAEVVKKVNDENTKTTIKEVLTDLKVDTTQVIKTDTNKVVNPTLYEPLTPFVDLAIKKEDQIKFESTGEIKATVTIEAAKDMKKKDILIMQIDPNTGKVYFVEVEKLNKKTGEITATFPTLGPVTLMQKVPIVVKDVSPENYPDKKVADTVIAFKEEKSDLSLTDVLDKLQGNEEKEIEIADGKTINVDDYSSSMGFADMAIKQGDGEYLYDMDGSLQAEAHRDVDDTDWERMVQEAYPDFDVDAAKEDKALLTELDSFTLEDSFVMQMNPVTGEVSYIENPEISFVDPQAEEEEAKAEENEEEIEEETDDDLMGWVVEDEDKKNEGEPNLVIKAQFTSMGPFAIFMPKDK